MNELQVVVQQTPGTVTWNYEDLKPSQTIRITGSPEDYQKVIEYIKAMGIDYEEV